MQTAILNTNSKSDLKLLLDLAKKIGIKAKLLTDTEVEDMGLSAAIKEGNTGEYVDTASFIKQLRK